MLKPVISTRTSDWNKLLRLGERLLKQPDSARQCQAIVAHLQRRYPVNARIWLSPPYYPLPGEPPVPLTTDEAVPELVKRSISEKSAYACLGSSVQPLTSKTSQPADCWVLPMIAQDSLLGVMWLQFSKPETIISDTLTYLEALAAFSALTLQVTRQAVLKNWRFEQLSLVSTVSNQIANVQDLDELCNRVIRLIQKTFHYYFVAIFTAEPHAQIPSFSGIHKNP